MCVFSLFLRGCLDRRGVGDAAAGRLAAPRERAQRRAAAPLHLSESPAWKIFNPSVPKERGGVQ